VYSFHFLPRFPAILFLLQLRPTLASDNPASSNITLPGLPYPEDSIGVMAVSVADLHNGLCTTGAPPLPVAELTIAEAHAAFGNGTLNCSSLVKAYLQRIAAFDRRTELNSVINVNPKVLVESDRLDRMLKASLPTNSSGGSENENGGPPQEQLLFQQYPLFCVPILVKDNFDVLGMPTTAGSVAFTQNFPQKDATVVGRLKSAGAIILGKSSMGEFALFPAFSISSLTGVVRNPYHLGYTPAGSSGGSAAGIAAGLAMASIGSDTGNSVRGPASHTALVGLRPSIGLVSRSGLIPLRFDRDTAGPLTRTVEDTARLLSVMQGFDRGDNLTQILLPNDNTNNINYVENLNKDGLKGARIGVLANLENLPGTDEEMFSLFTQALEDLEAAGATIVQNFKIQGNSLGSRDWDVNRNGQAAALGQMFAAGKWRDIWLCSWMLRAGLDEYLRNATNSTSANNNSISATVPRNLREVFQQGLYHPAAHQDLQLAVQDPVALSSGDQAPCQCGTLEEDVCRVEFRNNLIKSMDQGQIDVIIYPTWTRPPLMIGQHGDGFYDGNLSPIIAPHVGAPAITVPMGYTGEKYLI
jgi:amidase